MSINNYVQDNNYPKKSNEEMQHQNQDEFDTQKANRSTPDPHAREQQSYPDSQSGNQDKVPDSMQKPNEGDVIRHRN